MIEPVVDPRRNIPRTDELLAAVPHAARESALSVIRRVQEEARAGGLAPGDVRAEVIRRLAEPYSLKPVLNATGVIIHTNLGRAPLPPAAVDALVAAAGYTDVELDLDTGQRSSHRGAGAIQALRDACPSAEDALIVNNGAAALLLATTALAEGGEAIISRGELIEIGAGFRLPELIESARVTLREVGATNRTHLRDYERALNEKTGAILKVHPSNFRIEGFTASVSPADLRQLADENNVSLIVDLGSGLLTHDPVLPEEPDLHAQLASADVVIASGDKLLGGPQAGILLGRKETIATLASHPLARALRIDKLRLNALEAAIRVRSNAVQDALHSDPDELARRTHAVAAATGGEVVPHDGRVGGGGAPEYPLPGVAVALPEAVARPLRCGTPAVLPRVKDGQCIVDLRCIPAAQDVQLIAAIQAAQGE